MGDRMTREAAPLVAGSLDHIQRLIDGQIQADLLNRIRALITKSPDPDVDTQILILAVASAGASIIAELPGGLEAFRGMATRNAIDQILTEEGP